MTTNVESGRGSVIGNLWVADATLNVGHNMAGVSKMTNIENGIVETHGATGANSPSWKRHWQRIASQGFCRSLSYYLLTVGGEKCGVKIMQIFQHSQSSAMTPSLSDAEFSVVASAEAWTPRDVVLLNAYGGEPLMRDFAAAFDRGEKCAIARCNGGDLACVCWLTNANGHLCCAGQSATMIQRCFTLPQHRGKKIYPQTLAFAVNHIGSAAHEGHRILIECSKYNYASQRGIRQAGFIPIGRTITAFSRTWTRISQPIAGQHDLGDFATYDALRQRTDFN